ncbi:uroporphyrinogen-III C-methyltransferase [Pedobacter sp. MC2016-05]|uniref:uroporphyrinogen-III C-methyltransferase n=1 Tax=Pedobacter sp. MC2016-05 TaxID=2994474 RepID=UPI002245D4A4|nr:uroporphyrinogen-III C-methyltransferase [Pedobacter sp. MC2016-05]MCX2474768.1 uroporphyrinogen-III C-methyltransferase [Pedobacter sp. MC2016-05]
MAEFGLFIMGAGPGDPELLTMKAYNVLKRAEVVLYDNLSNQKLLEIAPKGCEMVYVGKKPYEKCTPQEKINELIVKYAKLKRVVVRLKGGDPFIFGRGFEETLYAEAHGIKSHYIPGISSMQGLGFIDVPLTHRGISESVWIITATKKDGSLSKDLACAMKTSATVVIYMGMKKLAEISAAYKLAGLGSTPAAIIQHATLPHQKQGTCEIKDIQEMALKEGLSYPAIIVIGDVVKVREIVSSQQYFKQAVAV